MSKTILITGATDGIGLLTAQKLAEQGHRVLLHGRSRKKLDDAIAKTGGQGFLADLSSMADTVALAQAVADATPKLDALINNAGVLKVPDAKTPDGFDVRFMVNTFAPLVLTRQLLPIIPTDGRVINLSSAAQAPVNPAVLSGTRAASDMDAYAQSKLAITIWTQELARTHGDGPAFIAVNPGSLLASKMVKDGFGVAGNDLSIGADILCRAVLDDAFAGASGKYFDNDSGRFAPPHSAARDASHVQSVMDGIETALARLSQPSS